MSKPLDKTLYQYKQRLRSLFKFQEAYEVTDPETGEDCFYGKRDRLWFKKDAHVFEGGSDNGPKLVTMKDNSFFDMFGSFTAIDENGNTLAKFTRKFWKSFFWKETWIVEDADGNKIGELKSQGGFFKTFMRKFSVLTIIPYIGGFLDLLMFLNYDFINEDGEVYAEFKRKFRLRDFYKLEVTNEDAMNIDKKALIGMGVLLDAAEGR